MTDWMMAQSRLTLMKSMQSEFYLCINILDLQEWSLLPTIKSLKNWIFIILSALTGLTRAIRYNYPLALRANPNYGHRVNTANSYIPHICPKNSPTRMLVCTRLLPSLAHTPLPFDFWIACIQSFMYCSWNLHPQVPSLAEYQLCHLQSSLRANWSSRSLKSLTPKSITISTFASYCT